MALPSLDLDIEAQTNSVTETQSAIISPSTANAASPQLPISADLQPRATNTNQHHSGNASAAQSTDNSQIQRDENQGDSSDGLWSMYLTESEKRDAEVLESWKGDTNGILVFTGLFSATVAAFIIESYKKLSPDSGDITNALLVQISQQFVDFSHGKSLANVTVQSEQSFKPTASAVRVNVFWFLSLILSLSCALSATLMQQWARRYQELAQRRGAFHRRGRMRAYIFDGIHRFGMARAVATMPTLLHISVFLFFAGLVEFLFPIYTTVAYATLGCIMVFALAYAILTVLPTIRLNCPYGTPLSGFTWLISQLSMIGFLWAILNLEGLFRISLSKLWCLDSQHALETHGLKRRRETLEKQVKIRRQRFSQGLRKTVELGAYRAESRVVTSALVWTLAALDEDKEIEDFAARVPGFFDSRVVPDATLAIFPLMSHQPNTDPILGSRLYDLLKTCIPETSILDEKTRNNRLRVCMKCLWSFARACNQLGPYQVLPSYFQNALASPEITRARAEKDTGVRVIGRCFAALIANKLATDLESRTDTISRGELACLSAILGTKSYDVELLLSQPGAVALVNMTSLMFDDIDGLVTRTTPSGVLDVVQQTLDVLSQALSSQQNTGAQLDQPIAMINGSDGVFECTLKSHLLHLLNTCMQVTSPLTDRVRTRCLRVCLKGLWYFGRTFNQPRDSVPFPSHGCIAFTNPEMIRRVREQHDLAVRVIGRCVEALIVNRLAADIKSRNVPVSDDELACLSTILGTKNLDVMILLNHPGAIEFTNMIFLALDDLYSSASARVSSDVPDVVKQTFAVLSLALPAKLDTVMPLYQTGPLVDVSNGTSPPTAAIYRRVLRAWMMNLWHFTRELNEPQISVPLPSYVRVAFTNQEMTRRIREEHDLTIRVIGRCVEALVVNKLVADINLRNVSVTNDELACLSAILGTKSHDVMILLSHPGAIEFTMMVFLALDNFYSPTPEKVRPDVLDVVQQTFGILLQALPAESNATTPLDQTDTLMSGSDGTSPLTAEMYRGVFRAWMMNLWHFTREFNGPQNSVPLPSYVRAAFTNPEMTRRIREERDLAVRVIGRCVGALVVNKLAADINSRNVSVTTDELACLSAILGTKGHDVTLLLSHRGAIGLTNMVFLTLDDSYSFTLEKLPSCVLDVVQKTSIALSQGLPLELIDRMRIDQTDYLVNISDVTSPLTAEMYQSVLRGWMMKLWHFTGVFNGHENSVPLPSYLPSYICAAFANPEMSRRIREERDLAARVIGRCAEVLVVNKLAADIKSRVPARVTNNELACLSATLGTKSRNARHLLNHIGAIEFTNLVFFILDDFYSFTHETVPSDVLKVVRQTSGALSRVGALPAEFELNTRMQLDLPDTLMSDSDGTSPLTADMYRSVLRMWMENLWHCIRWYYEPGDSVPSSSPLWIAFASPEMTRRIHEGRDLTIRVIGRCIEALVISKLVADINSRNDIPVRDDDQQLACLATILGTKNRDVMILLSHPGAIEFTMMVFLVLDNFYSFTPETVPLYVLDVVRQTFGVLSQALPTELNAKLPLGRTDTVIRVPNGTSSLTAEMYRDIFRACMMNLWHFTREFNEPQNSVPLPSYVRAAFTNPEMTRRIREERDLAVRVIGRCVGALVVNKLAADINSRGVPITQASDELACLSATLGTEGHDVLLLLNHTGAIEFTNEVFLTLDDFYSFTLETLPSYVLDVVHQTFSALFQGPSHEVNVGMRLNQTDNLVNISDVTSSPTAAMYRSVLREWMKNLWHFTRDCNERGNPVPLPSHVRIAFTNQEMIRRIREERDPTVRVIGRCVGALVVNKLAADINSRDIPVADDELACLSTILDTETNDVRLCLGRPGTIELVNLASLALGDVSSLRADQMPPDMSSVLQQTLTILSHALPAPGNAEQPLDLTNALVDVPDDKFERVIVPRLYSLLNTCVLPGTPFLTEEVRASCLRMCLKTLWNCGKAYHQTPDPLPSYFPLELARPEITRHFPTEQDLVASIMGCCFGALIVSKLVDAFKSPIYVGGRVLNEETTCISAILGTEHHKGLLLPHHLHVINFRNVVSLMSDRVLNMSTAGGMPVDVALLSIVRDTLYTLANSLRDSVLTLGGLRRDQERLLLELSSDVVHALRSDPLEKKIIETLDQLRQILEELPPIVEQSQDTPTQNLDH